MGVVVNSKAKGDRGERALAKYLRGLGFYGARRSQQYSGRGSQADADVVSPCLPGVWLECKFGYPLKTFRPGLQLFTTAVEKARREAVESGRRWAIAWKPKYERTWRLTSEVTGRVETVEGDAEIERVLRTLNGDAFYGAGFTESGESGG
jgi:Holliday junction resolvase